MKLIRILKVTDSETSYIQAHTKLLNSKNKDAISELSLWLIGNSEVSEDRALVKVNQILSKYKI